MIKSFKTQETEQLFNDERVPKWQAIENPARRKLNMVNAAKTLEDLKVPPGNKLHKLDKDREGQCAIWIQRQVRVCFIFRDGDAYDWRLRTTTTRENL